MLWRPEAEIVESIVLDERKQALENMEERT